MLLASGRPTRADDQAEGKRIIDKAIEAHGGAPKLMKFMAASWKGKGTFRQGADVQEFTGHYAVQFPVKSRFDITGGNGRFVSVLNGNKGWARFGDDTQELDMAALEEMKENLYAMWLTTLTPLSDKSFLLTPQGESKSAERPVLGVKIAQKGHRDVLLYFDKDTWLLAKSSTKAKNVFLGGLEFEAEDTYSDYKEFDGVKRAMKMKQVRGKMVVEITFSDYKLCDKLSDELFVKP
ncbi:MAG TPA: hypothetical protein VG099_06515 [Gemmataceae bacterium]|nr:hypothetical protein [Gemmataceae bacterium]